ncbi:hypothetical protein OHC85_23855 [Escherichia coli]|nr:hypothetical protein [Escherichia coli]
MRLTVRIAGRDAGENELSARLKSAGKWCRDPHRTAWRVPKWRCLGSVVRRDCYGNLMRNQFAFSDILSMGAAMTLGGVHRCS